MLYINIPEGWTFNNTIHKQDVLTRIHNDDSSDIIPLQNIVKECLRNKRKRDKVIIFNNEQTHYQPLTIHFKIPTNTKDLFLKYLPNQNGKYQSSHTEVFQGTIEKSQSQLSLSGSHHCLWFKKEENKLQLSSERLEKILIKSQEQKENRRHTGDSPYPT